MRGLAKRADERIPSVISLAEQLAPFASPLGQLIARQFAVQFSPGPSEMPGAVPRRPGSGALDVSPARVEGATERATSNDLTRTDADKRGTAEASFHFPAATPGEPRSLRWRPVFLGVLLGVVALGIPLSLWLTGSFSSGHAQAELGNAERSTATTATAAAGTTTATPNWAAQDTETAPVTPTANVAGPDDPLAAPVPEPANAKREESAPRPTRVAPSPNTTARRASTLSKRPPPASKQAKEPAPSAPTATTDAKTAAKAGPVDIDGIPIVE
jgi:hypothetical protein